MATEELQEHIELALNKLGNIALKQTVSTDTDVDLTIDEEIIAPPNKHQIFILPPSPKSRTKTPTIPEPNTRISHSPITPYTPFSQGANPPVNFDVAASQNAKSANNNLTPCDALASFKIPDSLGMIHNPQYSITQRSTSDLRSIQMLGNLSQHLTASDLLKLTNHASLHSLGYSPFDPNNPLAYNPNTKEIGMNLNVLSIAVPKNIAISTSVNTNNDTSHGTTTSDDMPQSNTQMKGQTPSFYNVRNSDLLHQLQAMGNHQEWSKKHETMRMESTGCMKGILCNIDFYANRYNVFRVLMLIVTLVFFWVCMLYSIGQICTLELDNYVCNQQSMSLNHIHDFNRKNGNMYGDNTFCKTTNSDGLINESLLNDRGIAYTGVFHVTFVTVIRMLSFLFVGVFLLFCFTVHSIKLTSDCMRFYYNAWLFIYFRKKNKFKNKNKRVHVFIQYTKRIIQRIKQMKVIKFYQKWLQTDRIGWVIGIILRELLEILIQTIALLQYGGYNSDDIKIDPDVQVYLAEKPVYVIVFSIFLTLNCCCVGVIWLLYIFKHDYFSGKYFFGLILIIDAAFDIFYSFFPLILRNNYNGLLSFFASLQSPSIVNYLSMLIPLIFLSSKMHTILSFSSSTARKDWRLLFDERLYTMLHKQMVQRNPNRIDSMSQMKVPVMKQRSIKHANIHTIAEGKEDDNNGCHGVVDSQGAFPNHTIPIGLASANSEDPHSQVQTTKNTTRAVSRLTSRSHSVIAKVTMSEERVRKCRRFFNLCCYGPFYLESPMPQFQYLPLKFSIQLLRRMFILLIGSLLLIYGFVLSMFMISHFSRAYDICRDTPDNIEKHPELLLWEHCNYKVYPFLEYSDVSQTNGVFYPCQCRSFAIELDQTYDWNAQSFQSMFENWWMLEKVIIHSEDSNQTNMQLSLGNRHLKNMASLKILSILNVNVDFKSNEPWSAWRSIELLRINNGVISSNFPDHFSKLSSLKYLSLDNSQITNVSSDLCSHRQLKHLSFSQCNYIESLPFDCIRSNLLSLRYVNFANLSVFNETILELPQLQQYIHYSGQNVVSIPNIDNVANKNALLYLQGTPLCQAFYNLNMTRKEYKFVNETKACNVDVLYSNSSDWFECSPHNWGNGRCDDECNNADYIFDLGDCAQLCDFNECDIGNSWSADQIDVCNNKCNNKQCLYDQHSC